MPEIGKMKLMIIANDIYKNRQAIIDYNSSVKGNLRDL